MKEINCLLDIKEMAIEDDFPYSAIIEILTKCNFNCKHCYIPEHVKEMDYETVISIVDQLYDLGIFEITLTGGEVAVHSSFMDIVRYIRKKGIKLELMSNASLFTKEIIDELAGMAVSVSTTLFSMNGEVNDSITKYRNSNEKVLHNVLYMKEKGMKVDIKVPVMKMNYTQYEKIDEFCKEHDITLTYSVAITPRTNGDDKPMEFALDQEELNLFICKHDRASIDNLIDYNEEGKKYLCSAVGNNLGIEVNGDVFPCNSFHYKYGNVHQNSLQEIWYELPERKKLKSIKKSDLLCCSSCKLNNMCVRCPGLAYTGDGDLGKCSNWDRMIAIAKAKTL